MYVPSKMMYNKIRNSTTKDRFFCSAPYSFSFALVGAIW